MKLSLHSAWLGNLMSWKLNEEDLPQPALNLYYPQQTGQENIIFWIPSPAGPWEEADGTKSGKEIFLIPIAV